jgi:tRNA(Ile2) C34 agmatinyltransferase TiaS
MHVLLGVDDTDVLGHKPGTGRLARDLGAHLQQAGLATLLGVVRHQLLVDPRIPYTSHNSPACLILEMESRANGTARRLFDEAAEYVRSRCAQGSDPGLCFAARDDVAMIVVEFGWRAGNEVLNKQEAWALAQCENLRLEELGGTGDGVIGALAAVGLTAEGNAGRYLELGGGLRDLPERLPASVLRQRGIALLSVARNSEPVAADAEIFTEDRVRPRLIGGRPVLLLERTEHGWRCFDRKPCHEEGHGGDEQ